MNKLENLNDKPMYTDLEDKELLFLINQKQDAEALDFIFHKYKKFVQLKVRPYFLIGGDKEDLMQEGMIGLFKAIRDYQVTKDTSFKNFSELCIKRQVITAIKSANRKKHSPLNTSISLHNVCINGYLEVPQIIDLTPCPNTLSPEEIFILEENFQQVYQKFALILTDLEIEVLKLYLQGQSYKEISTQFNRSIKAIDNALTRIKNKFEKHITKEEWLMLTEAALLLK